MRIVRSRFDSHEKPDDALELLVDLAEKIEKGELDMADAARRYSDDRARRAFGGDIGFLRIDGFGKWAVCEPRMLLPI